MVRRIRAIKNNNNTGLLIEIYANSMILKYGMFFKNTKLCISLLRPKQSITDYLLGRTEDIIKVNACRLHKGGKCGFDYFFQKQEYNFSKLKSSNQESKQQTK